MIASLGIERLEGPDDDVARALESLAMEEVDGSALEAGARPGPEGELGDDEIGRAAEEIRRDER